MNENMHLNNCWIAVRSVMKLEGNILNKKKIEKLFQWFSPRPVTNICVVLYIFRGTSPSSGVHIENFKIFIFYFINIIHLELTPFSLNKNKYCMLKYFYSHKNIKILITFQLYLNNPLKNIFKLKNKVIYTLLLWFLS